jgi:hypothetical protein
MDEHANISPWVPQPNTTHLFISRRFLIFSLNHILIKAINGSLVDLGSVSVRFYSTVP